LITFAALKVTQALRNSRDEKLLKILCCDADD
jgi:hypothetical protein